MRVIGNCFVYVRVESTVNARIAATLQVGSDGSLSERVLSLVQRAH